MLEPASLHQLSRPRAAVPILVGHEVARVLPAPPAGALGCVVRYDVDTVVGFYVLLELLLGERARGEFHKFALGVVERGDRQALSCESGPQYRTGRRAVRSVYVVSAGGCTL
jgi:hypothetical protein